MAAAIKPAGGSNKRSNGRLRNVSKKTFGVWINYKNCKTIPNLHSECKSSHTGNNSIPSPPLSPPEQFLWFHSVAQINRNSLSASVLIISYSCVKNSSLLLFQSLPTLFLHQFDMVSSLPPLPKSHQVERILQPEVRKSF